MGGTPAALDFAVTSPQRSDYLALFAQTRASAASEYEGYKRRYMGTEQDCARQGITFIPMVAEPSGAWGPQGLKTLSALAHAKALHSGVEAGPVMGHLLQSLCVGIRRASARAVLKRAPVSPAFIQVGGQIDAARAILAQGDADAAENARQEVV